MKRSRILRGADATFAAGAALGEVAEDGDAIGLVGDLGAGKTLLVQGLAAGLGVPKAVRVTSPTFTLLNEYRGGRLTLFHADLYRLADESELDEIGYEDALSGGGVLAVEWSDRFSVLPGDHLRIELRMEEDVDERILEAEGRGQRARELAGAWWAILESRV